MCVVGLVSSVDGVVELGGVLKVSHGYAVGAVGCGSLGERHGVDGGVESAYVKSGGLGMVSEWVACCDVVIGVAGVVACVALCLSMRRCWCAVVHQELIAIDRVQERAVFLMFVASPVMGFVVVGVC